MADQVVIERSSPTAAAIKPEAQQAMRIAIWLLFAVYVAPLVAIALLYIFTSGFSSLTGRNVTLDAFVSLASTSDQSLALVHRALLPLMAGLAPIAFNDPGARRSSTWLMILLIAGIALSIFLSAVFNANSVKTILAALTIFPEPASAMGAGQNASFEAGLALVTAFFTRVQESLGMYLLMLFGLTLTK